MSAELLSLDAAQHFAVSLLGKSVTVQRHPKGFGNQNWVIRTGDGVCRWVLKVAGSENEAKWRSSHLALDLARSVGVPVPELLHAGRHGDSLVRVFTWIDGRSPVEAIRDASQRERFVRSLAEAIRSLHTIDTGAFGSRLDGSSPRFEQWSGYLNHRFDQVRQRCVNVAAVDVATLDRGSDLIHRLADSVSPYARPTVCHRDLHADNLLVSDTGELVGIIDWDSAESWDPAGEWFKLTWMLAESLSLDIETLTSAYLTDGVDRVLWQQRVRVVDVIETLNTIPYAMMHGAGEFEASARRRLTSLLE